MRLEEWRLKQGLTYQKLGEKLGMKTEPARRLCLPPTDRLRTTPNVQQLLRIAHITGGLVAAADFDYSDSPAPPARRRRRAAEGAAA